jgi:hypothetical protein
MVGQKKRLLWVDDDIGFIDSHLSEVQQYYDVDTARDADEFWQKNLDATAHRRPYDGFIVDILLPFGTMVNSDEANGGLRTGIALVDMLKASEDYRKIPVVVFTIRWSSDVDALTTKYQVPVVRKQDPLDELMDAVKRTFG